MTRMRDARKRSITADPAFWREVEDYARRDDRSLSSLLVHATRQCMKRYPIRDKEGGEERKGRRTRADGEEDVAATVL